MAAPKPAVPGQADVLMAELRGLIESAPSHVAQIANTTLTMLYWHVGQRIQREGLADRCQALASRYLDTEMAQFFQCVEAATPESVVKTALMHLWFTVVPLAFLGSVFTRITWFHTLLLLLVPLL